ncbi:transient receptor potential cation channel subfamily M member-like 2 isoform X2 [Physella acuta]|uniref:transient receptor potential cation channel subfamily M member-like 2 isoform X2 n=1 Tax=Physella acuta TaxID=109671 RepID=UPI0027DD43E6|nr:transient receptor potential cation channel subfamily M member-like 2 isoform X2 [Physella acuta]
MVSKWDMTRPDLLISVTGGAEPMSLKSGLRNAFRRGLMKAAESTNAWILTAGTHAGVMKHVGEAVEQFSLTAEKDFVAIGIAPWGRVKHRDQLENIQGTTISYEILDGKSIESKPESYLDPNHTHFILVDDGREDYGGEIELRSKFERHISQWKSKYWTEDYPNVPVCLLVLNGGPGTLDTVKNGLALQTPTIVIKGSGRMADILADVAAEMKERNQKLKPNELDEIFRRHDKDFESKWFKQKDLDEIKLKKLESIRENVSDCCKNKELFSVYELKSYSSEDDLDSAILRSILKDNSKGKNTNKLLLALIWDRFEMVESYIAESAKTSPDDAIFDDLMKYAIKKNRLEFVEQFLNNDNINLEKLIKKETLAKLYQEEASSKKADGRKETSKTPEEDLNKYQSDLKKYMGDYYQIPDLKTASKDPFYDLFIWAVLKNYFELSKVFLKHSNESSISACLFASDVLSKRSSKSKDRSKEEIEKSAEAYKQLSIDLLKQCYSSNRQKTHDILCMVRPEWGNTSCMFMAARSENKLFIAEPACQDLIKKVWRGLSNSGDTNKNRPKYEIVSHFCKSARFKFAMNIFSYAFFLVLFSYILVVELSQNFHWTEAVLLTWIIAFAFEELAQCLEIEAAGYLSMLSLYIKNGWNKMDLFALFLFIVGLVLRIVGRNHGDVMAAARIVLSLDLILYFFGVLHMYTVLERVGPKIVMIKKMVVQDLLLFIAILAVFVVSYAIASEAILYPNTELTWRLLFQLPRRAYWNIYGELFLDDIEGQKDCTNNASSYKDYNNLRCPSESGRYVVPILMGFYMILTNVLLLNLLIAMFSYTFKEVEEKTKNHASFQKFNIVLEYAQRPILPTPLTIPFTVIQIVRSIYMKCGKVEKKSTEFSRTYSSPDELTEQRKLIQWENAIITTYFDTAQRKEDVKGISRKDFEKLSTDISADIQKKLKFKGHGNVKTKHKRIEKQELNTSANTNQETTSTEC